MEACSGNLTVVTTFQYDAASQITQQTVTDDSGDLSDTTTYYDNWGRVFQIRRLHHQNQSTDFVTLTEYNDAGLVKRTAVKFSPQVPGSPSIIEGQDQVTSYQYNNLGETIRVKRRNEAGAPDERVTYQYDGAGRRTAEVVDSNGLGIRTDYQYDTMGRITKVTDPESHYRDRAYDSRGNLIREVAREQGTGAALSKQTWHYDDAGRLTKSARWADAASAGGVPDPSTDEVVEYGYDGDGRRLTQKTYNHQSGGAQG